MAFENLPWRKAEKSPEGSLASGQSFLGNLFFRSNCPPFTPQLWVHPPRKSDLPTPSLSPVPSFLIGRMDLELREVATEMGLLGLVAQSCCSLRRIPALSASSSLWLSLIPPCWAPLRW